MTRTSKYDSRVHPRLAKSYARKGLMNYEIAEKLKISRQTLYTWCQEHPELFDALNFGRDLAVAEIEESQHKKAKGYDYEETKIIGIPKKDKNGKEELKVIRVEKTTRHQPPSEKSADLLLRVWDRSHYNQAERLKISGDEEGPPLLLAHLSDKEVEVRVREILATKNGKPRSS